MPVPNEETLKVLLESHRRFLAFLVPRVKVPQDAEEILQSAFGKAIEHGNELKHESAVAWFYRLLRNALVDYYRRQDIERRAIEHHREHVERSVEAAVPQLEHAICECFRALLPTLKPEYAEILNEVDLGKTGLQEAAANHNITPNNAAVRLHRARLALKKRLEETCRTCAKHGCFDCSCRDG
jgi:RNA polymerase sigma-70 factor (ECF subfamily)